MKQDLFAFDQKMKFQGDLDFEKKRTNKFLIKTKKQEQVATISAVVAAAAIAAIAAATSTASEHLESEIFFVYFPNSALISAFCATDGAARIFHVEIIFSPNLYDFLPPYAAKRNRTHVTRVAPHRGILIQDALPS